MQYGPSAGAGDSSAGIGVKVESRENTSDDLAAEVSGGYGAAVKLGFGASAFYP